MVAVISVGVSFPEWLFFSFFFFFFLVGERGNASCTVMPKRCVWDSSRACHWVCALWTVCPVSYPLKPLSAGRASYTLYVKLTVGPAFGSNLVKRSSAQSCQILRCLIAFLSSSMKRVSFQLLLIRSVMRSFNSCVVSLGVTS